VLYPADLSDCLFCSIRRDQAVLENLVAIAVKDRYPVAEGHSLVIPRKHVSSVYDLATQEQNALWDPVRTVQERLLTELKPWMLVALSLVAILKVYQAYAPKRRFNVPQDVERQIEKAMRR
jgi:hypothetical protein